MSFLRPEASALMLRWREVLVGIGCVLLGLWWLIGPAGLLALPAVALLVAGAALIWVGVQRARFRGEGKGPGVVQVDEGQIAYFGPINGGVLALREIESISIDHGFFPAHWRLRQVGADALSIPVNAAGSDRLFDAFATLPGFRMERALAGLKARGKTTLVVWQREMPNSAQITRH